MHFAPEKGPGEGGREGGHRVPQPVERDLGEIDILEAAIGGQFGMSHQAHNLHRGKVPCIRSRVSLRP